MKSQVYSNCSLTCLTLSKSRAILRCPDASYFLVLKWYLFRSLCHFREYVTSNDCTILMTRLYKVTQAIGKPYNLGVKNSNHHKDWWGNPIHLLSKKMNHQSMMAAHLASLTPIVKSKTANKRQRVGSNTCPKCDVTLKQEQECISCCVCELNFCIECT